MYKKPAFWLLFDLFSPTFLSLFSNIAIYHDIAAERRSEPMRCVAQKE